MSHQFDKKSTADEVANAFHARIEGKTVVITGATSGLGEEAAKVIAKHSPKLLVIAGRSDDKLKETSDAIKKLAPNTPVKLLKLDLGSFQSVREAAHVVNTEVGPVNILLNNAGIMACPYRLTNEGFESQFGTNHMGHFLFTNLILPQIIAAAPGARIVNVSSLGHRRGPVRFDDVNFDGGKTYEKWTAYGQAKTANILFSVELARRYKDQGVTAFSLHPGGIFTPLQKELGNEEMAALGWLNPDGTISEVAKQNFKSVAEGTSTHLYACFAPEIESHSGAYLEDCKISTALEYASNPENAKQLWELSEKFVFQKGPTSPKL